MRVFQPDLLTSSCARMKFVVMTSFCLRHDRLMSRALLLHLHLERTSLFSIQEPHSKLTPEELAGPEKWSGSARTRQVRRCVAETLRGNLFVPYRPPLTMMAAKSSYFPPSKSGQARASGNPGAVQSRRSDAAQRRHRVASNSRDLSHDVGDKPRQSLHF